MNVYLDNNSTTRIDPRVARSIEPYLHEVYGNPSNIHHFGRECAEGLAQAREQVAAFLGASPDEIFFTSSGTESDNLAVKGVAAARKEKGNHIITSAIEHSAVRGSVRFLGRNGWQVTILPVDRHGLVDPDDVRRSITDKTVLVSVMLANNEIGTIEPVREIAAVCRNAGVTCHTDAVAAAGKIEVDVQKLDVDLLTISGHKLHAPKGVGVLYVREGTPLEPLLHGGHQEKGLRPGTENVIGIVGMGAACELLGQEWQSDAARMQRLRDRLERSILERVPEVRIEGHPEKRVPNVCLATVGYVEGEALILSLDLEGVAVASGSACSAGEAGPSPTIEAIGVPDMFKNAPVRFSLGRDTTEDEIDYAVEAFARVVERLRSISPVWKRH
ncbi:MAG: cysteine desulfurase family protein [candidate division WOR-3 bacterium]